MDILYLIVWTDYNENDTVNTLAYISNFFYDRFLKLEMLNQQQNCI